MRIHLPNSAFLGNIDPFLRGFDPNDPERLVISANPKWISVHPVVLSMIAVLGRSLGPQNIACEQMEAGSSHYLERMGLFAMLGIDQDIHITEHESAGRFIPLSIVDDSEGLTRFITDMVPLLHLDRDQARPIEYVVSELIRNVLEHARSPGGAAVCAQYYKRRNRISIGIADTGVGILQSISQSYAARSHLEAIRLALMPGVTGTTRREGGSEFNAGAGLFFIRSIAKVNRNFFMIYSGTAMYKLLKTPSTRRVYIEGDPLRERCSVVEDLPFWKGTVVGIDISLDATEEFTSLLDLIHEVYIDSVRKRKKARYRAPRFQ